MLFLQETKVANLTVPMANDLTGSGFDYACLPAVGASGGALVAWRRDLWAGSQPVVRPFSVTISLRPLDRNGTAWWLSTVYGPTVRADKPAFLSEIRDIRAACQGPGSFVEISTSSIKRRTRTAVVYTVGYCGPPAGSSTTSSSWTCTSLVGPSPGAMSVISPP